jgi:PhoH-like ATPase
MGNAVARDYVVDTNVLLDDPDAPAKLRNGCQNRIHVPFHVLLELDRLKKEPHISHIVAEVVDRLLKNFSDFQVLQLQKRFRPNYVARTFEDMIDLYVLEEIRQNQQAQKLQNPIFVTNDKILQLIAKVQGVECQNHKDSIPFRSRAEHYTGIFKDEKDATIANSFFWKEGQPFFRGTGNDKIINFQNDPWKITTRSIYQNLALELMLNPEIDIVSVQSEAGYGKSYLALASALYLALEKKLYQKIYIVKPPIEIGKPMGYLPGRIEEKMAPYIHYISDLIGKLHDIRPANGIFKDPKAYPLKYDPKHFEILPLQFIRSMNIENSIVIIDEMQNMTRTECRALLSRMCENVKCFCLGDVHQVDNRYLNSENNGLNWVVKKFMGKKIYAHIVLKGSRSRGPITDLVIQSGL